MFYTNFNSDINKENIVFYYKHITVIFFFETQSWQSFFEDIWLLFFSEIQLIFFS